MLLFYDYSMSSQHSFLFTELGKELPLELIQTLLKTAPTIEEEAALRKHTGELSLLGPAEQFLKALIDIPFAFKKLEFLHFMCTLQEDISMLKKAFVTLEVRHW